VLTFVERQCNAVTKQAVPCAGLRQMEQQMEDPWPPAPGRQRVHSAARSTACDTIEHHDLSCLLETPHESQHVTRRENACGATSVVDNFAVIIFGGRRSHDSSHRGTLSRLLLLFILLFILLLLVLHFHLSLTLVIHIAAAVSSSSSVATIGIAANFAASSPSSSSSRSSPSSPCAVRHHQHRSSSTAQSSAQAVHHLQAEAGGCEDSV
jgi:hypothetical protein